MMRPQSLAIAASFAAGLVLGCVARPLDLPADEDAQMPACVVVWGYGEWDDGRVHALIDDEGSPSACQCMTSDELKELALFGDEQLFIEHELNQRAFEECKRVAALYDFDWDPCQEYYETGEWRTGLSFTHTEDTAYKNREGLTCGDDFEDELTCALSDRRDSSAWLLLVLGGLLGLRRRRHA